MRKPDLCTQNTSVYIIIVNNSLTELSCILKIFAICKLHEIPYILTGEKFVQLDYYMAQKAKLKSNSYVHI